MAYSLINQVSGGNNLGITTSAIDTTGADLIVIAYCIQGSGTLSISDNKSNTYTLAEDPNPGAGVDNCVIYYCQGPTVGAGHTFSASGVNFACMHVAAYAGSVTTPLDQKNGLANGSGGTSIQPGSVTPATNNQLVVTGVESASFGGTASINGGFTITTQSDFNATGHSEVAGGQAYLIQTTATAANPTWSWASNVGRGSSIVTFKAATGAAANANYLPLLGVG